ncbi:hypothetical protein BKA65DRAFT_485176 [Rhexocercosporidium sp. MPI-PUGE-AT-0058]|nr:hypothetical protein BKA65DRAFT_485176 [Rhexocercosporidium sp. MPI-PUGE-AT-0058]
MGRLDKYVDGSKREDALKWKARYEIANRLADEGKLEEAVVLCQQNLDWSLKTLGTNHNCTVSDQEALAQAFYSVKNFEEARKLDLAALTTRILVEGTDPPSKELLEVQLSLAQDYVGLKKYKEAARIYEDVYKSYTNDDIQALKIAYDLAACWHHLREYVKSQDLNKWVLERRIKCGASEYQITQSKEALKKNSKKIESVKKKKEAAEKKKAEEAKRKEKSAKEREAQRLEQQRRSVERLESKAKAAAKMKATEEKESESKAADQKKSNEEMERKRLEEVEARALERERLAKEARFKERAEKSKEARQARMKQVEADRAVSREFAKASREEKSEQNPIRRKSDNPQAPSSPIPIPVPMINVQKPQQERRSAPKSDVSFLEGPSPGLPMSNGQSNRRPRASSQDSRDMTEKTEKIHFRHISRSDIFSQLGSVQGASSSSEAGDLAHPIPGSWVSDNPARDRQSRSVRVPPQRQYKMPETPEKAPRQVRKSPSPSLKPDKTSTSPPGLSRSRSLNNGKDKEVTPPTRAKSVSVSPGEKRAPSPNTKATPAKQKYSQLFDAKRGKADEDSLYTAKSWFQSLQSETQKLLLPLRRSNGKRVKIAILDTGIDLSHPDFKEDQSVSRTNRRIKIPEDFLDVDGKAHDTCGHGTHCVGLLRKVAPEADIYVARVAKDFNGALKPEVVAKAISRACSGGKDSDGKRNWNVDIITMSFGFYNISPVVRTAIRQALAKPVLVFAAASNNGTRRDIAFPASMTGVFGINSASGDGGPSSFNPELKPDKTFSIIGENVRSSWTSHQNGDSRRLMTGTSVATPVAAAVAALVLEYVMQNDPESFLIDNLNEFKEYDGMSKIFSLMSKQRDGYKNIVPWELLTSIGARRSITGRIEWEMKGFGGQ